MFGCPRNRVNFTRVVNAMKKLREKDVGAAKAAAHTLAKRLVELEYIEPRIK
jgi:hypothetical protein